MPHGGDPLYVADPASDGRWQRGEAVAALYLAEDAETAWAEYYRGLAEAGLPVEMSLPRDLWRYDVQLDGVVDLSTAGALEGHGLHRPARRAGSGRPSSGLGRPSGRQGPKRSCTRAPPVRAPWRSASSPAKTGSRDSSP